jgi:predicted HTH domain antitoxin
MTIEFPDEDIGTLRLTPAQDRLELAIGLYAGREITLGRAAKVAAVPYTLFMQEAARRGVCINYTEGDATQDVATVEARLGK